MSLDTLIEDPLTVYDTMREAANRLVAVHAARVTIGGMNDPEIQAIRSIRDEMEAVGTRDVPALMALRQSFIDRREEARV